MKTSNNTLSNLIGKRFGNLVVIDRSLQNSKSGNARWDCICDCGNKTTVIGSHLRNGHTKSCGCIKLGEQSRGKSTERLYRIWTNMHKRCYNAKAHNYKWYGGIGITVCEAWHNYKTFEKWANENGYNDNLSIDRIDQQKHYSPDNCRWANQEEQANNRSNNRIIAYQGESYTISQFAKKYKLSYWTVTNRLRLGWDLDRIVSEGEKKK